jgi:ABC-type transport system involved in multi-copper enzyme maturation permease subunit
MGSVDILHYRPWRGEFCRPVAAVWPVARIALWMIFRRKLFWVMYALGLFIFLLYFFGQYLLAWAETQTGEESVRVGGFGQANPAQLIGVLRALLNLNGTGGTYGTFFNYQGWIVMIVLALAGAVLVGNDIRFGSLPFYLSKPLSRWHYLLGKGLAVAVFINLMTTLPALVLYVQYGLLDSWDYFLDNASLFVGILAYGLVLTVTLTLVLLATASWLQRTVPLIMAWSFLFLFCRLLSRVLVEGLHYGPAWRLIDLWNCTYVVGHACLGIDLQASRPGWQPAWYEAALVLAGVGVLCLSYLVLRIRAVEIVK